MWEKEGLNELNVHQWRIGAEQTQIVELWKKKKNMLYNTGTGSHTGTLHAYTVSYRQRSMDNETRRMQYVYVLALSNVLNP